MSKIYKCLTEAGLRDFTEDELYEEATQIVWALLKHKYSHYSEYHEDIAQDVIIVIFKAMERYDPAKGTVFAYIKTIAYRRVYSAARRINAHNNRYVTLTDEMAACIPAPTPSYLRTGPDYKEWLRQLRELLTDEERKVIELKLEGASNVEIYNALHPGGKYKKRIGTAVAKLWESIAQKARELGPPED